MAKSKKTCVYVFASAQGSEEVANTLAEALALATPDGVVQKRCRVKKPGGKTVWRVMRTWHK